MPLYIYKNMENFGTAMEQYVTETLRQGLYGWQVTDCTVSLIRSQYSAWTVPRRSAARSAVRRISASSPRWWSWRR